MIACMAGVKDVATGEKIDSTDSFIFYRFHFCAAHQQSWIKWDVLPRSNSIPLQHCTAGCQNELCLMAQCQAQVT